MVACTSPSLQSKQIQVVRRSFTAKPRRAVSRRSNILSREGTVATPTNVKPRSVRFPFQPVTHVIEPPRYATPKAVQTTWLSEYDTRRIQAENHCIISIARAFLNKNGYVDTEVISLIGLEHYCTRSIQQHRRRIMENVGQL